MVFAARIEHRLPMCQSQFTGSSVKPVVPTFERLIPGRFGSLKPSSERPLRLPFHTANLANAHAPATRPLLLNPHDPRTNERTKREREKTRLSSIRIYTRPTSSLRILRKSSQPQFALEPQKSPSCRLFRASSLTRWFRFTALSRMCVE